jgi:hypothetical protein
MNALVTAPLLADLPPPPPQFSLGAPDIAAGIAMIFLGIAATFLALRFASRRRASAKRDR